MAVISLLFLTVMYVVHHPLMVSDRMDLDTLARSRQLEKRMSEEMRQLEMEFEEKKKAAEQKQRAESFWRGDTAGDQLPWSPFTNTMSRMPPVTCPAPVSLWRALWMISSKPVGCSAAGRPTRSWRTVWVSGLPLRNGEPPTKPRNLTSWCPSYPHRAPCLSWR
ncbi:inositol 1,4,5-trisphosphate receptor-interacting protein-like 1 isoform X2 [Tupaia chinensis]|uniref:inositol 1,4,5-trisphosphate receptor-interacting protein-like 1 isoform X2 n=1 Tax=Tupaia chinensis TaxID=246437 RepID=UPI000FFB1B3F|nr:inositol 1,4,5-trisphosphate receptor-interacting protein-like 1 isoform X2 [Tupaia chinensis]